MTFYFIYVLKRTFVVRLLCSGRGILRRKIRPSPTGHCALGTDWQAKNLSRTYHVTGGEAHPARRRRPSPPLLHGRSGVGPVPGVAAAAQGQAMGCGGDRRWPQRPRRVQKAIVLTDETREAASQRPTIVFSEGNLFLVAANVTRRGCRGCRSGWSIPPRLPRSPPQVPLPSSHPLSPINTLCAHQVRFVQSGLDLIGLQLFVASA